LRVAPDAVVPEAFEHGCMSETSRLRPSAPLVALGIAGAAAAASRMRLRNLGATEDEVGRALPGDDVIPDACTRSTMATTIDAPRWAVWAWLVQMGYRRGGWYSYDRFDNAGVPSAERIQHDWQHLAVGDRMPSRADGKGWFDVAVVEHERVLVLRASLTVPGGRSYDPSHGRPRRFSDSTWAFALDRDEQCRTRLIVRTRNIVSPRLPLAAANLAFWDPAHLIMERRQLSNLRRRAEATNASSVAERV
jgi:hypothetical protein